MGARPDGEFPVCEKHFWKLALGVVLVAVLLHTFDFALWPPSCRGLVITRPFCGLHSWARANRAWAARNHLKYGLGYTKGYRTIALGDPPPAHPLRYVSHPPWETWILALGMLLLGQEDWSVRLFDVILSVPILLLILSFLRKLYHGACALVSGLLLVLFPLTAFFEIDLITLLLGLWALHRYLSVVGREHGGPPSSRYRFELAAALFLIVQMSWVGVFYAVVLGLHYMLLCLARRCVAGRLLGALFVPSFLSLVVNFGMMAWGNHSNIKAEAATSAEAGVGLPTTALGRMKALYLWRARSTEQPSFPWMAWLGRNVHFARTNFTTPVLLLLGGYLLYLVILSDPQASGWWRGNDPNGSQAVHRPFVHVWFFLLPALLFLFTFKGLFWVHQYWQAPFAMFVALGAAQAILLLGDLFGRIHRWIGSLVTVAFILALLPFCHRGLASYRAERWQSPRTISLFKELNRRIPSDQALLTYQDFMTHQSGAKPPFYRPEYAWYLDHEMTVANAWQYQGDPMKAADIDDVVDTTIAEIRRQAGTGRFPWYLVPAREKATHEPLYRELWGRPASVMRDGHQVGVTSLEMTELDRLLRDSNKADDSVLLWEKHRRYRKALIARLKGLYRCEYYDNNARPGAEDFCAGSVTPCYLFDLGHPK